MKRTANVSHFVWITLLIFIVAGSLYPAESRAPVDLDSLEAYFEQGRLDWHVPGLAVAIVKDGQVVLARGYGIREINKTDPVDEKTLFAIASNTKAFTAAGLAMLVGEGKIGWNDKVRDYLPYFKLYAPYVTETMTIEDLLCHRSGLAAFSGDLLWYETSYSTVEVIKRARYLKPVFGFRDGYGYSNIMFMAAGEIVPAVTGQPWPIFIRERIFQPLGMARTQVGTTGLKQYDNVATPHHVAPDGRAVTVAYTASDQIAAAGGINSCVSDMARWLQMLLADGTVQEKQLLNREEIHSLWSMHNSLPVSASAGKLFPSTHFRGYGLGWFLSDYHGRKVIDHGGGLDGMISRVALVPEIRLGLVILSNSINNLPSALMYRIIDAYLGAEPRDWSRDFLERRRKGLEREAELWAEKEKKIAANTVKRGCRPTLADFAGLYRDPMYGTARVSLEKNRLVLDLLPAPVFISDLIYIRYDTFRLKLRNIFSFIPHGRGTVQFFRDKDGRVTEMKIDIPNHDFLFHELAFTKIPRDGNGE